jgi:hypothetical protein
MRSIPLVAGLAVLFAFTGGLPRSADCGIACSAAEKVLQIGYGQKV